ncbi:aquaporin [Lactococcus hodotermopsidis]|uniref:Aquaporin n=1 Tax=Pseudolactococcus hodotermopsidis TaxID=2709157 RepID=A0A6A0BA18_9LACT|nr:aquaglyceroporin Gla [Lactococcus hodotermopsidis]GFH41473.1 aquaporin [Lactococcus hodotermopsidis]
MEVTWMTKYIAEFIGTAILVILGNGAVANVDLKGTKGFASGWMTIAWGYGCGVMIPALMFGNVSGNHINPAFTLGLAVAKLFPWAHVAQYIVAQFLGAIVGQAILVMIYRPYYLQTTNSNHILGTFSTIDNVDDGNAATRGGAWLNGFLNEFVGSFVLFFGALALTKNFFGSELVGFITESLKQQAAQANIAETSTEFITALKQGTLNYTAGSLSVAHLALGFLVMTLVASLGGATGPALNPARDLGPRLLHAILPKSILGDSKADSKWWYAWVPVIAPVLAGIAAVATFKILFLK